MKFSNLTLDKLSLLFISSLALLINGVRYCLEKRKPTKIKTKLEIIIKSFSRYETIKPIKLIIMPNK